MTDEAPKPPKKTGRPKGSRNVLTKDMRLTIMAALKEAGGGGKHGAKKYLKEQAKENPVAFMALLGKLLPKDVKVDGNVTYTLEQLIVESSKPKPATEENRAMNERPPVSH